MIVISGCVIFLTLLTGVLWDTKVNRSSRPGPGGGAVDELLVVGAFDTVSKTSQVDDYVPHSASEHMSPPNYND
jgi:hypothetical protein